MKKYVWLIIITCFFSRRYSQNVSFQKEPADSCTIITEKKISDNRVSFSCRHLCKGDSYYTELEDSYDKGTYFRCGVSIWYYDDNFTKVRKRSTYWRGDEYGIVQEFYENGLIKLEGLCKIIRYFPKYTSSKDEGVLQRIDLMDTTIIPNTRRVKDSINALDKYRYYDSVYKPYTRFTGTSPKNPFPYFRTQKYGEWKYYDETGKLLRREYYIRGILSKTISY